MTDAEPGTYALLLKLDRQERLTVGRLGTFDFPAGYYLYVGSALGPGGLRTRLARYWRGSKGPSEPEAQRASPPTVSLSNAEQASQKFHWHIDYLLQRARLVEVWGVFSTERLECQWGQVASGLPGARVPVRGFGSSDCRCSAHLIYFSIRPTRKKFEQALRRNLASNQRVWPLR